ncbi:MAG: hypothetical protein ACK5Q5_16780 [Planctomycetaceae bacterium]
MCRCIVLTTRRGLAFCGWMCWASGLLVSGACAAEDVVAKQFAALDKDGNGSLSVDEISQQEGRREMHVRDHKLFDFDGNSQLSLAEFSAIPGLVPPHLRGAIADPFDEIRTQALEALDESHNAWQYRAMEYSTQDFVNTFAESLGTARIASKLRPALTNCDFDSNGKISRAEAQRFVLRQLGLFTSEGERMRMPNGRVLNTGRFQWLDADKGGTISDAEYLDRTTRPLAEALKQFQLADKDQDDWLTWEEYRDPELQDSYLDPVERFRKADTDWDALLSAEELEASLDAAQKRLAQQFLIAFDLDGDGHWSLVEYQLGPWGGPITNWSVKRFDKDRSGGLSFEEFLYNDHEYVLLQRMYFSRFDRDADGLLTADEFSQEENRPNALYRLSTDGASFRPLWHDQLLRNIGSPALSPDGQSILLDRFSDRQIWRLDLQTETAANVCEGVLPSWSRDGQQFACSARATEIHTADGRVVSTPEAGWGGRLSPDGRWLASIRLNGVWVYDLQQNESREVLSTKDHTLQLMAFSLAWSPDSTRVLIQSQKPGENVLASVHTQGEQADLQVHFTTREQISLDLDWSPDGRRLVFAMYSPEQGHLLLHQLDMETGSSPTIYPGIDTSLTYLGQCFSSDGSWMVVVAK